MRTVALGSKPLTDDTLYTFIVRHQSGTQNFNYCNTDIGGAG